MRADEASMSADFATITTENEVAIVTMDDGRANALSISSLNALSAAFRRLPADVRGVALLGRPRFFSGGIDLKAYEGYGPDERAEHTRALARTLLEVFTFRRPIVAGVTGHAIAGGALLALACDARVMAAGGFKLTTNEVALGVDVPDFGLAIIEAAVPRHLTTELLLHGTTMTSEQAFERGLVSELTALDAVADRARARARALASTVGQDAYAVTKNRLRGPAAARALETLERDIEGFSRRVLALATAVKK
jgi:enoyl-CoA hydratase